MHHLGDHGDTAKMIQGMTKITRHSATAALQMLPGGVLVVRLTGPLTGDALQFFKREIVQRHGPEIRAFVADYTRATIALTGADLDAVLEGEGKGSAPAMPAALVVRADMEATFTDHAARMALHGVRRRVFMEHSEALTWCCSLVARSAAAAPAAEAPRQGTPPSQAAPGPVGDSC